MSNYRRNAEANRDALFGPNPGTRTTNSSNSRKPASSAAPSSSSSSRPTAPQTAARNTGSRRTNNAVRSLTGQPKIDKMNEAEEYRNKAKKALQRTLFSSPDPIAGAMFYHRAAEAYKLCGENRLERLHRIASGDCQMGHDAFASAAGEYVRAAELAEVSDETNERKKAECTKLYADAAKAWREEGELGRAGECMLRSGFSLLIPADGDGDGGEDELIGGTRLTKMPKDAMTVIEGAVENHVPDPLNRYRIFRQTGVSSFIDPDADADPGSLASKGTFDEDTLDICQSHMVKSSFAHETLTQAMKKFVEYGEFKSALYTAGAVSALLQKDGFSTITLSRAFCCETLLTLALGDVVAADKHFLEVHLQNNTYLSSRECKLAEDLIRAIKLRDLDDLDAARDPGGENRGAMANMDPSMRHVIAGLRISGSVKKSKPKKDVNVATKATPVPNAATAVVGAPTPVEPPISKGGQNLENELDDLMNDMGLGSDDDMDDDDDDLDLR